MINLLAIITTFILASYASSSGPMEAAQKLFQQELIRDGSNLNQLAKKLEANGFNTQYILSGNYDGSKNVPPAVNISGTCHGHQFDNDYRKNCTWTYVVSATVDKNDTALGYSCKSITAEVQSDYLDNAKILKMEIKD